MDDSEWFSRARISRFGETICSDPHDCGSNGSRQESSNDSGKLIDSTFDGRRKASIQLLTDLTDCVLHFVPQVEAEWPQYRGTPFIESDAFRRASIQLGLLDAREDLTISLPMENWRYGQEHEVWRSGENLVLKATYRGRFGCLPWGGNATPLQYLARQKFCNELFGDCIELVSVVEERGQLRLLTLQPFILGSPPEQKTIDSYIAELGFKRIDVSGRNLALWTAPYGESEIVIGDLHPGNALVSEAGELVVIDGIVCARPCTVASSA